MYLYSHIVFVFCILVFVCGQVPRIICIRSVTNAYISVVYFQYIYIICDVFYFCFNTSVADPPALRSASRLYTQTPGFTLHGSLDIITFICELVWY